MHPSQLPPEFDGRQFTTARALAAGVSPRRLRAADLDASVAGTRGPPGITSSHEGRVRLFALRLSRDVVFSHSTAARLLGIPVPLALERTLDVHATVAPPSRAPHARGLLGHRRRFLTGDIAAVRGLSVTSAARTWIDLASELPLGALVAAGDFIINWRLPLASITELRSRLDHEGAARGVGLLKKALPLLSDRAESPPESELRVILALGGLPAPRINHVLVDSESGEQVRPDFVFREQRVILEYQGDYHRTRAQWRKDMTRRTRLEVDGWYVMELNADDLKDPIELVERVRKALTR